MMNAELIAMASLFGKSIRVISFQKGQAFTLLPQMKLMSVDELSELAEIPMHEGYGNIVEKVVKFAEYSWDSIQADRFNTDNDFIFIHAQENSQLWNADGKVIWKRLT